jgi:plasmid stabilization system protein ParE
LERSTTADSGEAGFAVTITLLSPALREILEAIDHYEAQAVGLSAALDADLTRSLEFIQENPLLGSPFQSGTRRVLLHRFPYSVVYKVLDDRILVVALAHQSRRPGYWRARV